MGADVRHSKLKNKFDSLRKTYVTLTRPYKDTYVDSARNRHPLTIYLSDTMLTSPGGSSLRFLNTYRTMCVAPSPDFRQVLEDVRHLEIAA